MTDSLTKKITDGLVASKIMAEALQKVNEMHGDTLKQLDDKTDDLIARLRSAYVAASPDEAADEIERLKSIASKAIREQVTIRQEVIEECALVAESTMCSVTETVDYFSGYCDGVMEAAAAVRAMK